VFGAAGRVRERAQGLQRNPHRPADRARVGQFVAQQPLGKAPGRRCSRDREGQAREAVEGLLRRPGRRHHRRQLQLEPLAVRLEIRPATAKEVENSLGGEA